MIYQDHTIHVSIPWLASSLYGTGNKGQAQPLEIGGIDILKMLELWNQGLSKNPLVN